MGPKTLTDRIRHYVYVVVLPIYLWSIGFRTLDEYIAEIERQYDLDFHF